MLLIHPPASHPHPPPKNAKTSNEKNPPIQPNPFRSVPFIPKKKTKQKKFLALKQQSNIPQHSRTISMHAFPPPLYPPPIPSPPSHPTNLTHLTSPSPHSHPDPRGAARPRNEHKGQRNTTQHRNKNGKRKTTRWMGGEGGKEHELGDFGWEIRSRNWNERTPHALPSIISTTSLTKKNPQRIMKKNKIESNQIIEVSFIIHPAYHTNLPYRSTLCEFFFPASKAFESKLAGDF